MFSTFNLINSPLLIVPLYFHSYFSATTNWKGKWIAPKQAKGNKFVLCFSPHFCLLIHSCKCIGLSYFFYFLPFWRKMCAYTNLTLSDRDLIYQLSSSLSLTTFLKCAIFFHTGSSVCLLIWSLFSFHIYVTRLFFFFFSSSSVFPSYLGFCTKILTWLLVNDRYSFDFLAQM